MVAAVERRAARTRASMSRATAPRSRPLHVAGDVDPARAVLALDLVRRRARSRRRRRRPAAPAPPAGVSIGSSRSAATSPRTAARPTRRRRRSSAPRRPRRPWCPCTSVVAARRTSPGVRPNCAAASGRSRTSTCGTSTCGSTLQVDDARRRPAIAFDDLLRLRAQHVQVRPVEPHDDRRAGAGQHLLDALVQVGQHVAVEARDSRRRPPGSAPRVAS